MVIDASLTVSWFFEDETTPENEAALERVEGSRAIVPAIWRLEVANAFQNAARRGRTDMRRRDAALMRLAEMPISFDLDTHSNAWGLTLQLADRLGLTIYDAAYLELAQRMNVPLATLDKELSRAAVAEGVELIGR